MLYGTLLQIQTHWYVVAVETNTCMNCTGYSCSALTTITSDVTRVFLDLKTRHT